MTHLTNRFEPTTKTRHLAGSLIGNAKTPLDAMNIFKELTRIPMSDGKPIVSYMSDLENYGALEFWASPDETIDRRSGDCDDITFLIGAMLNGLPDELKPTNVRLTIGEWQQNEIAAIGQAMFPFIPAPFIEYHAWTEADVGNKTWIIDGVGRFAGPVPDVKYRPHLSLYPDKILMLRRPR